MNRLASEVEFEVGRMFRIVRRDPPDLLSYPADKAANPPARRIFCYHWGMSEERKRNWRIWLATMLVALPFVYVLSAGPTLRISIEDDARFDRWMIVYKPLIRLSENLSIAGPLTEYLNLWLTKYEVLIADHDFYISGK